MNMLSISSKTFCDKAASVPLSRESVLTKCCCRRVKPSQHLLPDIRCFVH